MRWIKSGVLLSSATRDLAQFVQSFEAAQDRQQEAVVAGAQVNSWDDPFTEAVVTINPQIATPIALTLPAIGNFPGLRTNIVEESLRPRGTHPERTAFVTGWRRRL